MEGEEGEEGEKLIWKQVACYSCGKKVKNAGDNARDKPTVRSMRNGVGSS